MKKLIVTPLLLKEDIIRYFGVDNNKNWYLLPYKYQKNIDKAIVIGFAYENPNDPEACKDNLDEVAEAIRFTLETYEKTPGKDEKDCIIILAIAYDDMDSAYKYLESNGTLSAFDAISKHKNTNYTHQTVCIMVHIDSVHRLTEEVRIINLQTFILEAPTPASQSVLKGEDVDFEALESLKNGSTAKVKSNDFPTFLS